MSLAILANNELNPAQGEANNHENNSKNAGQNSKIEASSPAEQPRVTAQRTPEPLNLNSPLAHEDSFDSINNDEYFFRLEAALGDSPFYMLPNEINYLIFSALDPMALTQTFQVCRKWSQESTNEVLWKDVAEQHYADVASLKPEKLTWKRLCLACMHTVSADDLPDYTGLGTMTVSTRQQQGEYIGEIVKGDPHGSGVLLYKDSDNIYHGEFVAGKKLGVGTFFWKNGNIYKGDWIDDKQQGMGEFIWSDGDHYVGEWQEDHRHGEGKYTWPKGSYYEGHFHMNDLQDKGRYTWRSGYYEGEWHASTRHGQGMIKWQNGNSFEGTFDTNSKSGYGVYRWSDGATYCGRWENDDRSGEAVTTWANGMKYVGCYKMDLRNGQGVLTWPNGDKFEGKWKDGGRADFGVFTEKATGKETRQFWREEAKIQYSRNVPKKFV